MGTVWGPANKIIPKVIRKAKAKLSAEEARHLFRWGAELQPLLLFLANLQDTSTEGSLHIRLGDPHLLRVERAREVAAPGCVHHFLEPFAESNLLPCMWASDTLISLYAYLSNHR